ncbi:MAG: ribonuclease R [Eubacteriales bacterium]
MITKENILAFMGNESYRPLSCKDMMYLLGVKDGKERIVFKNLLDELESGGLVIKNKKNRYKFPDANSTIQGTLQGHPKGFGFVIPDNSIFKTDIFISPSDLNGALDKDKVLVKLIRKSGSNKSAEGEIIKIIERGHQKIVGIFEDNRNFGFVTPDNDKICRDIYIPKALTKDAKTGDKVVVDITQWPSEKRNPEGKIIEILGNENSIGIDILSIIREHNLPDDFPEEVKAHLHAIPEKVDENDIKNRRDLRSIKMVTIDGADAKDLDDAVSVELLPNGNYKLGVHIADVTYYVKEGTPIDKEALDRGTSIYLVDRVIPMLPRPLSNGICSLNANVDRFAFSCEMEIDKEGKVVNHALFKSVINTNERMTYDDVTKILVENDEELCHRYENFIDEFKLMEELAMNLREKRRMKRGAIDFEFDEAKIILDENGRAVDVKKYERNISNRIIEEFMLVCNETVAEHMFWTGLPFIYRVHEDPDSDKLQALSEFIGNFGYKIHYKDEIHPGVLQKLLNDIHGTKEENLLSRLILRAMQQARYMEENLGHFGLAAKYYSHFTSPIRRYPDLMIHRIMGYMLDNALDEKRAGKLKKKIGDIAKHCSDRERVAERAERDTDDLKKCEYMQSKVDQEFEGIISSVTSFGFFVELDNTIEGLIRIQDLTDDYYIYDERNHRFIGEHTKKMYKLGDRIEIAVSKVNLRLRQIDFMVVDKSE